MQKPFAIRLWQGSSQGCHCSLSTSEPGPPVSHAQMVGWSQACMPGLSPQGHFPTGLGSRAFTQSSDMQRKAQVQGWWSWVLTAVTQLELSGSLLLQMSHTILRPQSSNRRKQKTGGARGFRRPRFPWSQALELLYICVVSLMGPDPLVFSQWPFSRVLPCRARWDEFNCT